MSLEEHNITVGQQMVSSCAGKQHQWQISVDNQKMNFLLFMRSQFRIKKNYYARQSFLSIKNELRSRGDHL